LASPARHSASNLPAERPQSDPRIGDYLDQVLAPLVGWVPYAARTELRAELQGHLEAHIAAYRELGSSPDAAVKEALAQSGEPQVVARAWERAWERLLPRRKAPAWHSMLAAVGCFGVATRLLYEFIRAALEANLPGATPPEWLVSIPQWLGSTMVAFLLPLLAGLATGMMARTRPAQAVLCALALLMPPTAMALSNREFGEIAGFVVQLGIAWIPIGCGSATLASWLRTRRDQAPKGRVIAA
jgi:hypothetical protein